MGKKRYVWVLLTMAFLIVLSSSGCTLHPESSFDRSGVAMDTSVSLRATGQEAKEAVDEGFERLAVLDKLAGQNEDSDVSRINAAAGKDYVKVDPAIYEMIEYAKDYSAKSQGEWDITIGVMTNLWHIGNADQHVPSPEEVSQALMKVNYKDILLRPEDHSVMLAKPGMAIDLGGVAKGYAVDEIRKIYEKHHIESGLINLAPARCMPSVRRPRANLGTSGSNIPDRTITRISWASSPLKTRPCRRPATMNATSSKTVSAIIISLTPARAIRLSPAS